MRLMFLVPLLVGCASSLIRVPDSEWTTVPVAERARIDREHAAQVAQLEHERAAAVAALATATATATKAPVPTVPHPASAAPGDEWAGAVTQFEQRKRTAMIDITNASTRWQLARRTFYQSLVELTSSKLAVLRCSYEVERAKAVDRNLVDSDTFDGAPYRAQLAETQQRWYAAQQSADAARGALTAATSDLTQRKATYADLVRVGPQAPTSGDNLRLADWNDTPLRANARAWTKRNAVPKPLELKVSARVANK